MSVPPESLAVGRCYLVYRGTGPLVCRIQAISPEGRITYAYRRPRSTRDFYHRSGTTGADIFAAVALHQVPCDWRSGDKVHVSPESIQVGQSYLTADGHVRQVTQITHRKMVFYTYRPADAPAARRREGTQGIRSFTDAAVCPVPCDWTPEGKG